MTSDQLKCIQLRDCFYAGYSMPQYCIDWKIKNPLIASYDPEFLWELYVQFRYDKRLAPEFCILSGESVTVAHSVACVLGGYRFEHINFNDTAKYDKIIMLTTNKFKELPVEKTIYFDSLLNQFIQYVYSERPLYDYIESNKGATVILSNYPVLKNNEYNDEYEKLILQKNIHGLKAELKNRGANIIETRFDQFGYTNDEVYAMLALSDAKANADGTSYLLDNLHPLVMTENGIRRTAYQDGKYKNTIWCMGTCIYYGIGSPYDKTIESYLQKILNESGKEYMVVNVSQFYAGRYQDIFYNLNRIPAKKGDIVLICLQGLHARGVPFFDIANIFNRPHEYGEVFADNCHINELGNKVVAEKFYEYLKENNYFKDYKYDIPTHSSPVHQYGIVKSTSGGGYYQPISA